MNVSPEEKRALRRSSQLGKLGGLLILGAIALAPIDLLFDLPVPSWVYTLLVTGGVLVAVVSTTYSDDVRPFDVERSGESLGLSFSRGSYYVESLPGSLIPAPPGRTAYAVGNVLHGDWRGHEVRVFDADAEEERAWWDDEPSTFRLQSAAARVPGARIPKTLIEPRHGLGRRMLHRQGGGLGSTDEFRKRFVVESASDRFASSILGEAFESWLLERGRAWGIRMEGEWVLLYREGRRDPQSILTDLDTLLGQLRAHRWSQPDQT